jgi:hypothetical protein
MLSEFQDHTLPGVWNFSPRRRLSRGHATFRTRRGPLVARENHVRGPGFIHVVFRPGHEGDPNIHLPPETE